MTVAGAVERDPGVVEVPVDVGHARRDLLGGRRVGVEVALVEADGPDVHRHRLPVAALPEHQLGRPAADVDDEHRLGRHRDLRGDRAGVDQRGLLVAGQHLRLDAQATAYALGEDGRVARVAGRRRRAEADPLGRDAVVAEHPGELVDRREGALQRLVGQHARAVDPLPEAYDAGLAQRHVELPVVAHGADEELDRVGPAVDGRDGRLGVAHRVIVQAALDARTRGPPVTEPVEDLVAERVDAAPQASDWPARTWRHLTRSGMPPALMPSISGTSSPARSPTSARTPGSARAPRGRPPRAPRRCRAGPASPSSRRCPRGCRCGRPRGGR